MEEKEIIPYNTPEDGVAPTITTMYARLGTNNLTPGEYGGAMGIMEISKDKMEEKEIKGVSVHPLSHKLEFDGNVNEEISPCLRATDYKAPHCVWEEDRRFKDKRLQALVESGKIDPDKVQYLDTFNQSAHEDYAGCIKARIDQNNAYFVTEPKSCASRKRGDEHKIETRNDELANCVTSIDTDSMVREPQVLTPLRTEEGRNLRKQGIEKFSNRALYPREDGVSNTITSVQKDNLLQEPKRRYRIRKLTEREVFRLMDVSEEDIDKIQAAGISKTSQYRLAGNSIVVNVLYHIFRKMFIDQKCEDQQLSLFDFE